MPLRLAIPVLAAAVLALGGCGLGDDGPRTVQARDAARFTSIDNRGAADVRVHVGARRRVRVSAGSKEIDDVRTEVADGTLRVDFDDEGFFDSDVEVEVWVPRVTVIRASGSGDVDASGFDAKHLDVRTDGSGDITLTGRVGRLTVGLDGSGDANLDGLSARDARVTSDGSGDTRLRVLRRLAANVQGSGDLSYHGDPTLTRQVDGSGEVRAVD